ncbi:MAG: hypothetical protein PUG16_04150 [Lachnospiraceae bacterium]|nr:hypothetical protein [Lachnospiraceae bacterium]
MTTNLENHITKSIRAYYTKKLTAAGVFLAGILILSMIFSLFSLLSPKKTNSDFNPTRYYKKNQRYIEGTFKDLYFTGYTRSTFGRTTGYYYYTVMEDRCVIVLLKPTTSEMGLSHIKKVHISAEICKNSIDESSLLRHLARDLSWNQAGMEEAFSDYMISEPAGSGNLTILLKLLLIFGLIYGILTMLYCLLCMAFPVLSHPIRRLSVYGNPAKMLAEAEEELSTLPQLATDDMFITEHYFIETSNYGVAIMPIRKIIWLYKYSTLHKFLWHHFAISYTMYITGEKRRYIRCPKNTKTDIDGIMDYLAEANHKILVGFNEKNRRKVEEIQGDLVFFRKIWSFLSRKV